MSLAAGDGLALTLLIALQFGVYAVGWALSGLLLRGQQSPLGAWAAFMGGIGLGFVLLTQRDESRTWLAFVGSNLGFLLGLTALWVGLARFVGAAGVRREPWLWCALEALALMMLGPGLEAAPWRVLACYGLQALIVLRMIATLQAPLRAQYAPPVHLPLLGLGLALAAVFVWAALRQLAAFPVALEVHRFNDANISSFFAYLLAAGAFNFCFVALTIGRLVAQLRRQSHQDPLTGLANRRAHEERIGAEWQRLRRGGPGFALVIVDLDHFKRINDEHGHAAGDAVLTAVAERLRATARAVDGVARIGGEEFALLMPGCDGPGAAAAAERLRQALHDSPVRVGPLQIAVSASIGVAAARPDEAEPDALFRRADAALYAAKREGRDRVVVAPG